MVPSISSHTLDDTEDVISLGGTPPAPNGKSSRSPLETNEADEQHSSINEQLSVEKPIGQTETPELSLDRLQSLLEKRTAEATLLVESVSLHLDGHDQYDTLKLHACSSFVILAYPSWKCVPTPRMPSAVLHSRLYHVPWCTTKFANSPKQSPC